MLRVNSLVRLNTTTMSDLDTMKYPSNFHDGTKLVFLGEIPNMPGHGIFVCKNHQYVGYSMSLFEEIPVQEVLGIAVVK